MVKGDSRSPDQLSEAGSVGNDSRGFRERVRVADGKHFPSSCIDVFLERKKPCKVSFYGTNKKRRPGGLLFILEDLYVLADLKMLV